MTAPERIWAVFLDTYGSIETGEWADTVRHAGGVEYLRADLCIRRDDPALLAVGEALRNAIDAIDAAYDGPDDDVAYSTRERAALEAITERMGRK